MHVKVISTVDKTIVNLSRQNVFQCVGCDGGRGVQEKPDADTRTNWLCDELGDTAASPSKNIG